jgi:subtilase family serine protease
MRVEKFVVSSVLVALLLSSLSYAASPDRITGRIDSTNMVELRNHVAPMAQSQFDQGPVDASLPLHVTMLFTPSAQQQVALQKLLADQQNPKSPKYHQWLTSDQFGQQFGLSQNDIANVRSWLESEGLKVTYVSHGHDFLAFEGSAAQVQGVFRTSIHNYSVKGKMHFANVTAPMIPAALSGIVGGFRGMHDFNPHPMIRQHPNYTVTGQNFTVLAPGDIATIYNLGPLYSKTPAVDGTGQKVVIAGQSDVYLADINFFRSAFGFTSLSGCKLDSTNTIIKAGTCSAGNFQMVVPGDGADPGISAGDLGESDLDIEIMSSVARGATIIFVTSSQGVDDSASWAIDQNPPLAPVISYSYGLCEAFVNAPGIAAAEVTYQKAATEGISFFAASGDAAAATCDGDDGFYPATLGPSVSYPASSPNVTGVGGTEFDEGNTITYWNAGNGSDGGSAISYIPETAWNDSALSFVNSLDGSGGGASNCAFGTGTTQVTGPAGGPFSFELCNAPPNGGFPKPTWQTGVTPGDSARDVPDISFSASNVNDPYIVCIPQSELSQGAPATSTCASGINTALVTYNSAFGGTSASTPLTAGMTVLMNQYFGGNGLGVINPQLYKIFTANPTGVFHDVNSGTNSVTGGASSNNVACVTGDPTFEPLGLRCTTGSIGFAVGGGHTYNQVTGLGSVDINAFVNAWTASRSATTTAVSPSSSSITVGNSVTLTATVTPSTATGTVTFSNGSTGLGTGTLSGGTATLTTSALTSGTDNVTATYNGDAYDNVSTSPATPIAVSGFTLSSPTATVIAGHTTTVTITLTPTNGFISKVGLSCSNPPAGVTCPGTPITLSPDGVHPFPATLTIATAPSVAPGPVPVTVSVPVGNTTITSTVSLTVGATDQSFSLALQGGAPQVAQGSQVTVTLNLTGTNGFNANVSYSCSDPASESTCTGPQGYISSATSPSFTVTAAAPVTELHKPFGRGTGIFYAVLLPGVVGILFTVGSRRRSLRGMRLLGLLVVLGASTLWMGACSGSNGSSNKNPGTPTGSYNFVITATTGGAVPVTSSVTVPVTVVP